jgi:hypothetical protein
MTNERIVESIRRGNACPELHLGESSSVESGDYERAAELLAAASFPIWNERIVRRRYSDEIAERTIALHRSLDGFVGELVQQGRNVDAEACRAVMDTMMRRFIVAPPREMEAVVAGCAIARRVLADLIHSATGRLRAARSRSRLKAFTKLDKLIGLRFDEYSQRADDAPHTAWAKGLSRCTDETARQMMAAIDEWDRTDQRLRAATDEEIAALDAVDIINDKANK